MTKKAIGVYGGCFDPFHDAHAMIAEAALRDLPLDRLLVIPTARPWHKQAHASLAARREQCRAALAGLARCEVFDDPVPSGEDSTTALLLASLRSLGRPLISIVGGDAFAGLTGWRRWKEALELASWAVVPRAGHGDWEPEIDGLRDRMVAQAADLAEASGRVWLWGLQPPPLSSSAVRARAAAGEPGWKRGLPKAVARKKGLLHLYGRRPRP